MAIERTAHATVVTGPHVNVQKWVTVKHGLLLEQRCPGMVLTRGPRMRTRFAAELGLKPRDSYEKFLQAVEAKIAAMLTTANAEEAAAEALATGLNV